MSSVYAQVVMTQFVKQLNHIMCEEFKMDIKKALRNQRKAISFNLLPAVTLNSRLPFGRVFPLFILYHKICNMGYIRRKQVAVETNSKESRCFSETCEINRSD